MKTEFRKLRDILLYIPFLIWFVLVVCYVNGMRILFNKDVDVPGK